MFGTRGIPVAALTFGSAATAAEGMDVRSSGELNNCAVASSDADDCSPPRTDEEAWRSETRMAVRLEELA